MKLYMHPVSMTSRPVRLFAAENKIAMDEQVVDLFTGEHMQPAYAAINPSCMVPCMDGARGARGKSDISTSGSGAAMYTAFECGRCGRWP